MRTRVILLIIMLSSLCLGQTSKDLKVHTFEISYKEESSPCIVTDIYQFGDETYITVDFLHFEQNIVDGYDFPHLVNTNPKLRTYKITSETIYSEWGESDSDLNYIIQASLTSNAWFDIEVRDGIVISLIHNLSG